MDRRSSSLRFNLSTTRTLAVMAASVLMALGAQVAIPAVAHGSVPSIGGTAPLSSSLLPVLAAVTGGNAYLSWWKLALVVLTFVFWVRNSDWINQDSVKLTDGTAIDPQFWNLMNVGVGLAGFFAAISIPIFWVGYPLLLLASLLPIIFYKFVRKKQLSENQGLRQRVSGKGYQDDQGEVLAQDEGVELNFSPAGDTDVLRKSALIKARQSAGFVPLKEMLFDGKAKRADIIQIDYSQAQAAAKMFVDGTWHATAPMDRPAGDALLVSLKNLAGLDPAERRAKQKGTFSFKSELGKAEVLVRSQGVKTGEKVRMKFVRETKNLLNLKQLGMFSSMADKFIACLNSTGIAIVSAPPKHGLSTTWQGVLVSADRLTRDCIGLIASDEMETAIENVTPKEYETDDAAATALKAALLAQPDAIALPEIPSSEVLDMLSEQVLTQDRSAWLQINSNTAAEALLRVYSKAGNRDNFRQAVRYASCQRLLRRLCEDCKQEVPVPPKTIKALGGDPKTQKTIYQHWRLPPPEERVDEKGREIEFPPCETCRGLGYIGRIAIFEMIKVNDAVREALKKSPKVAAIDKVATESKAKKSMKSGAYQLVLLGVTSLAEVQSTLKK
jgi:type II secretory ATPase GspE/PulE/Tfp pilus assembly ATPase PilB-like protein